MTDRHSEVLLLKFGVLKLAEELRSRYISMKQQFFYLKGEQVILIFGSTRSELMKKVLAFSQLSQQVSNNFFSGKF